uniref:glutathione transferase n=1 Tax=Heortia vitessoides TaxID=1557813 RepID=A0A3G1RJ86_9NEOP|nr:glutathione S-transferase siama 3 [Heortia vitessoides]
MSRKLQYFNLNGLAEPIRYILYYGGIKFEDVRYEFKSWPIKTVKDALPFGQLPWYEENGRSLNQSLAIARYVASQARLLPSDPWEQAVLDAAVFNIYDFWSKVVAFIKEEDPVKKQAMKSELFSETIDFYFSRFEKELQKNNGHFWSKLSWADFVLVGILESANLSLGQEIDLKKYPTIKALWAQVKSLPGVKEYVAVRKPYAL